AANHSGVRPSLSFEFGSTLSLSSSSLTTTSCPLRAAQDNGVCPDAVFFKSTSTSPLSSSSFTTLWCPASAANDSGVRRSLVSPETSLILSVPLRPYSEVHHSGIKNQSPSESGSTLPVSSRRFTIVSYPFPAAQDSGV
ncbi:hypothetical protein GQ44DRAFT_615400, partial [Phaeosphaeriaceae sp. PMI808]